MKKLERMARRALRWAEIYKADGDVAGHEFAMQRYRAAMKRLDATLAYASAWDGSIGSMGVLA